MTRRTSSVTISVDGITVSAEGPIQILDAIQRDAIQVHLPEPTCQEAQTAGQILADWLLEFRKAG